MTRDDLDMLLPFLANDTLTGDERRDVEDAVSADADLQAELAAVKAIRTTMQAEEEAFTPGEMGLARLLRDVDTVEVAAATPAPANKPWIWQSVAAMLLVALVGQTAFQFGGTGDAPGDFELASGEAPEARAASAVFRVGFAPGTTEADMRSLLLEAGVAIAGGPDVQGLYDLGLTEGADRQVVMDALIASSLVEVLETIE